MRTYSPRPQDSRPRIPIQIGVVGSKGSRSGEPVPGHAEGQQAQPHQRLPTVLIGRHRVHADEGGQRPVGHLVPQRVVKAHPQEDEDEGQQRRPAAKRQRQGLQQGQEHRQGVGAANAGGVGGRGEVDQHHRGHGGGQQSVQDWRPLTLDPCQQRTSRAHRRTVAHAQLPRNLPRVDDPYPSRMNRPDHGHSTR